MSKLGRSGGTDRARRGGLGRVFEEECKDTCYKREQVVSRQREKSSERKNEEYMLKAEKEEKAMRAQDQRWRLE